MYSSSGRTIAHGYQSRQVDGMQGLSQHRDRVYEMDVCTNIRDGDY